MVVLEADAIAVAILDRLDHALGIARVKAMKRVHPAVRLAELERIVGAPEQHAVATGWRSEVGRVYPEELLLTPAPVEVENIAPEGSKTGVKGSIPALADRTVVVDLASIPPR